MDPGSSGIRIHHRFDRHERRYCLFSVDGMEETFLYFSHRKKPLRSLVYGRGFLEKLPALLENEDLCVECGLGLAIAGGIALDDGECIDYGCPVGDAKRILDMLREALGNDGSWIEAFDLPGP